jgi:hypothetical protein
MKKQQSIAAVLVASTAILVLAGATTLRANGQAFFMPADRGPVDLVYFARVKDARTGRPIRTVPSVYIVDPYTGLYFPFGGDNPGHFRSPDIGAATKEVTDQPIDTKRLEIEVSATGYQTAKLRAIPRQNKGAIELDVRLEPDGTEIKNAVTVSTDTTGGTPSTDSSMPTFFLLAGCFGLAAVSAAARTVGRHESTKR